VNGLIRIADQLTAGKYTVLELDADIPHAAFNSVLIDGKLYKPTIPYDLEKSIAINATGNFVGKEISFV
jgi:hypothetical protein